MKKNWYLYLALCLFVAACSTTKKTTTAPIVSGPAVSYKQSIWPIIENKCAVSGCHVQGFEGGDFTIFEAVKKEVDKGRFKRLVIENKSMPPEKPLESSELKLIEAWLQQGGNNN